MNWGYKVLIVYSAFVLGILFLVFKSASEKTDLVTSDYYAQELKYQERIDESKRTNVLSAAPEITLRAGQLEIHFPKEFAQKKIEGSVLLYCPADENKDIKQAFSLQNTSLLMTIPPANKGLYELHISWETEGVKYYFEKKIMI